MLLSLSDTEIQSCGFEPHNIQHLFVHIHQHVLSWEHVESMTKQQAIDLKLPVPLLRQPATIF